MINKKLIIWYLEKKKKIDNKQLAFKKQKSTIFSIIKIKTKNLDGFRRKEKTVAIFFDIGKLYKKIKKVKTCEQQKIWKFGDK